MKPLKIISVILSVTLIVALVGGCECGISISPGIVKINEVMFNPFDDDTGKEWIELYNSGPESQNIEGWVVVNREGNVIANLPQWTFPPNCYLLVVFGGGTDDSNFTDGSATFYTQDNVEVLDNIQDEVAIYSGSPKASTILDFISWCSDGDYEAGKAHKHAISAKQWSEGSFLDLGFPSGRPLLGGFSIGRDKDSTDTDSPDDWARNGGVDTYFDTPGLRNTSPLFTTDWGIKLVQTQVNLFLIQWGHEVTHASHEAISKRQTDEESYVKARHSFTTTYAGYEDTFSGIGEYSWTRVSSNVWKEEINVDLVGSAGYQGYSFHYTREYEDNGLSQVITESLDTIHSYEVLDAEEMLPDVDPALEPLPEASTHTESKRISSLTTTRITQLALDEYRVEAMTNMDIEFLNEQQVWSFISNSKILSDTRTEVTAELQVSSNIRESVSISMVYTRDIDAGWYSPPGLGNINATYSKYDLTVDRQSYSLVEPGYYRMTKRSDRDYYDIECRLMLGGARSFEVGSSGYIERIVEAGEVIYRGTIGDITGIKQWQFYVDGWVTRTIGQGIGWVLGGLLGLGIGFLIGGPSGTLVGGGVGSNLGANVGRIVGDAIEDTTAGDAGEDTTKPTIDWEIVGSGSDKEKGWLEVKFTVSDDTEVTEWGCTATSQQGQYLGTQSYKPGKKSDSKVCTMWNKHCTPRTWFLILTATDSSGNLAVESCQFTVPARICTPNVEETKPADEDVNVPVNSNITVTFCKPMDTIATEAALSFSPHLDFTTSWSQYNDVITITPNSPLEYGTTYTVTISTEARSFASRPLEEPYTFSFNTEEKPEPPEVLDTFPPNGGIIPSEAAIRILFSKPMDTDSTTQALVIFPETDYKILWEEDNQLMIIDPLIPWQSGIIYEVTITNEASSEDGLNILEDFTFFFTSLL